MASWSAVIEALVLAVAEEVARPVNQPPGAGGTTFPVDALFCDEELGRLQKTERGRIVLTVADRHVVEGPTELGREPRAIVRIPLGLEAHLWVPTARYAGLERLNAIESLVRAVIRAIHGVAHGSQGGRPVADELVLTRDPQLLRYGQSALLTFTVSSPVVEGGAAAVFPPGSRMGLVTQGDLVLAVNPSPPLPEP